MLKVKYPKTQCDFALAVKIPQQYTAGGSIHGPLSQYHNCKMVKDRESYAEFGTKNHCKRHRIRSHELESLSPSIFPLHYSISFNHARALMVKSAWFFTIYCYFLSKNLRKMSC